MARMKPPTIPETPPAGPDRRPDPQAPRGHARASASTSAATRRSLLLVDTGIRLAEIAGLTVEDIDWDHETLIVLGKGRRPRTVAFGRKVAKALDRYVRARGAARRGRTRRGCGSAARVA